jgi:membrane-associated phospholipid phosphatase
MNAVTTDEKNRYFAVSLFLMLLSNRIIFPVGHILTLGAHHWNLSLPIDAQIPFIPWTVLIYNGINLWWLFIYWLIAHRNRREADRFFCTQLLAKAVSFLFFIFLPTGITRPELQGDTVWIILLRMLYAADTPDNLFPSIHCVLGWTCWIGIRGKKDIPLSLRISGFLLALAVCVSTLTVRQHVLVDVFAGILLSEICWWLSDFSALRSLYAGLADRILFFFHLFTEKVLS